MDDYFEKDDRNNRYKNVNPKIRLNAKENAE
jgi:hypothetical protein